MKRKKRLKNSLINLFLLFLLVIGFALIFNRQIRIFLMERTSDSYQISNVDRAEIENNLKQEATFDFDNVQLVDLEAVLKAQLSGKVLPVIGGVAIPSVKIQLPIFKGLSNEALLFGAGTFKKRKKMEQKKQHITSQHNSNEKATLTPKKVILTMPIISLRGLKPNENHISSVRS